MYCPETGVFTWRSYRNGCRQSLVAGSPTKKGYTSIAINGEKYYAHRLAWLYMTGSFPTDMIDHINGCRWDNRFANLRECVMSQNAANSGMKPNNSTGYKGVRRTESGKWSARCRAMGGSHWLGTFDSAIEAHEAYAQFAQRAHGEFCNLGEGGL